MKHKHHITPKHAGGTDDPSNLIELTVEEHAEAHKKLWEEYGKWQDYIAWLGLSGSIESSKIHSEATKAGMKSWWSNLTEEQKLEWKEKCKKRPDNYVPHKGHTYNHTEEAKQKIRLSRLGKSLSKETRDKISKNRKPATGLRNPMANPENRKKVSESKLGRKRVYMEDGTFKYIRMENV